jgi:hypothetical protein
MFDQTILSKFQWSKYNLLDAYFHQIRNMYTHIKNNSVSTFVLNKHFLAANELFSHL